MFNPLKTSRIFILLTVILTLTFGDSGLASLKIVPGVREAGMANTGVASAQGPQAIYFNPAAISRYNKFQANLYYAKWLLDMHHQSLFVVRPMKIFNIGFGVVNFSYGNVENRDNKPTEEPIGYFNPQDYSFFLTLSRALDNRTAIGVSGKFYYQKIFDKTTSGGGVDFGLKFFDVMPQMALGFSIINFGTTMRFIREKFWLPTEAKAGASYNLPLGNQNLNGALDLSYFPYDKKFSAGIGVEFDLNDFLFLRGGVRPFSETDKISTGLGIKLSKFRLEYSFSPFTYDLGTTHRFSLGFGY
jgi:hypothetical protein